MKRLLNKILGSFDTFTPAFSARKLTAFSIMILVAYCHKFVDVTVLEGVLMIDYCAMCICLGLVTAEQIIGLKTGTIVTETKTSTEESTVVQQ